MNGFFNILIVEIYLSFHCLTKYSLLNHKQAGSNLFMPILTNKRNKNASTCKMADRVSNYIIDSAFRFKITFLTS